MMGEEQEKIRICMKDQDGDRMYFNIRPDVKVINMLRRYCEAKRIDYKTVDFLNAGDRLRRRGTAQQVGLKTGDEIDVMVHFTGGGMPSK